MQGRMMARRCRVRRKIQSAGLGGKHSRGYTVAVHNWSRPVVPWLHLGHVPLNPQRLHTIVVMMNRCEGDVEETELNVLERMTHLVPDAHATVLTL